MSTRKVVRPNRDFARLDRCEVGDAERVRDAIAPTVLAAS